ncbi:MAG: glycerophosphodiester phosphodiesterase [Deltaproteobacteria bacterium]|nr:glycerophosphodiester phosphodiesterase [Deltaproteobacteria bacterium]
MKVLGHRGAPRERPENSLEGFERALELGADGVELDARRCVSGELVVCHDPTLQRTAGRPDRVRDTPWSELRRVDLGGGARLPRLAEVLALWGPRGLVNIEVKGDDADLPALARSLAEDLQAVPEARVLVSSFWPEALRAVRGRCPGVPLGRLWEPTGDAPEGPPPAWSRGPWEAVHPHWSQCWEPWVRLWRAEGLFVHAWTVDEVPTALALRGYGVTSVITNEVAAMVGALGARR